MTFAKTASEVAHWKPPGSLPYAKAKRQRQMFSVAKAKRQLQSVNENPTTRYADQQKKDRPK
ncbi:hypothetical protein [Lysinibacillus sp. Bpr_S20]|uniref:hypothetical protein n=1 Tax=Lysinibacillus sp. Bpr_S20 TaxID=2933964 RepID=UPI00201243A8|nr:hypothetical protein [Lysinibacillus sp. Bpr_S20]MCL1703440.1 hypothetical protein [Lysinibacillus sp. Bpr_S20]